MGRSTISNSDTHDQVRAIHDFWFGPLDAKGLPEPAKHQLWFKVDPDTDRHIERHFEDRVKQALSGGLDHWATDDAGLIALVVLLDQFTRNLYRGTAAAFSGDSRALDLARRSIDRGRDRTLPVIHRVFLYMPLEHAEDLGAQEQCVSQLRELAADRNVAMLDQFLRYAIAHRDVIAQFGRFPHRNTMLGRTSSAGERAYLERHGGF